MLLFAFMFDGPPAPSIADSLRAIATQIESGSLGSVSAVCVNVCGSRLEIFSIGSNNITH